MGQVALPPTLIDATMVNSYVSIPVGPFDYITIQVVVKSGGSATGATYQVKHSVDGDPQNAQAFPMPCTILGSGITRRLNVKGRGTVYVIVSTADGTTGKVQVSAYGD